MAKKEEIYSTIEMLHKVEISETVESFHSTKRGTGHVMHYLLNIGGPVTAGEISDATNVSGARIAAITKKLLDKKLITREHDTKDQRKVYIELTEKGREFITEREREFEDFIGMVLDDVGFETFQTLTECIIKLRDSARRHMGEQEDEI